MENDTVKRHAMTCLALAMTIAVNAFAATIPAELPKPDDTPPATDKPVKVYIMSGQSNMVGFGSLSGGSPVYPSIYLSADPRVRPGKMRVTPSGLLPHGLYQDAAGTTAGAKATIYRGAWNPQTDYSATAPAKETTVPLGNVDATLPAIDGPHTVVVKAFVEVPITGMHEIHAGFGDSSHAIATLDGKEVYRKELDGAMTIKRVKLQAGRKIPLTITFMKPGPAVFWMHLVGLPAKGTLEYLTRDEGRFACMVDDEGKWTARTDVTLTDAYLGKGRTVPLSPTANGKFFGPELGFGYVMGTFHDEPVLLIKSDIGNRSLGWDILPAGSPAYEFEGKMVPGYRGTSKNPQMATEKPKGSGWYAGKQYDEYTEAVRNVLDHFEEKYPQFKDQGYEVAGFVWWQGHKDGGSEAHIANYERNMGNLIRAWRKEFDAPEAKWVIATVGFEGAKMGDNYRRIAAAQLAVSGDSGKHPEFKGNVKTIDSRPFWRDRTESPTGTGYHYNHNAETYLLTGDALGRAMVELMGGKAEPPNIPTPEATVEAPKAWTPKSSLAEAAALLYENDFANDWKSHPAEPTAKQYAAMAPAMRPMLLDAIIPAYVASAPGVPNYRRKGGPIMPIVTAEPPKKPGTSLYTQLDNVIRYYNVAGIHDYDWKPFGPEMRTAAWHYYSFDPPEQQDLAKSDRYRKITYPDGMENWYALDFDPAAAGWKQGNGPFGQNDGKRAPIRKQCGSQQCQCDTEPATLWEKEVLLMRQTFELPEIDEARRYRIVVGGAAHAFAGEGFALYLNGKLLAETKQGHLKKGGPRGAYIYTDFLPELRKGKVTIAVNSFLRHTYHRNKQAPPRGHLSVWLESAELPEPVKQLAHKK